MFKVAHFDPAHVTQAITEAQTLLAARQANIGKLPEESAELAKEISDLGARLLQASRELLTEGEMMGCLHSLNMGVLLADTLATIYRDPHLQSEELKRFLLYWHVDGVAQ
jgi:hypothetical protein